MIKSGIFIINNYLDMGNRFFEITGEIIGICANQEIIIGGIVVRVLKIMICRSNWIKYYYFDPLSYFLSPPTPPPLPVRRRRYIDDDIECEVEDFCGCNIF